MSDGADLSQGERVSLEQVLRVAELAQLALTTDEQTEMLRDLNSILGHVAQLNELDTANVPAMAQVSEMLTVNPPLTAKDAARMGHPDSGNGLRGDVARVSLDRAVVMAEAPETDGAYFKVPKVIGR
jgi:aspartyl-tRNA(Asn)/glutamyl-tRNA(Gln) amidotransferase subunit C